jgi:outer membrane autotransporter protein
VILNNNQIITGGRGGDGGGSFAVGGNGGDGGIGLYFVSGGTLNNSGSISGGAGGAGGNAATPGTAGANGPGVEGSDLAITNSGTIAGASGNGVQANAITFTGGANTLTLQSGSTLIGNIAIEGGGSVTFNQTSAQTVSNAITGNGSVIQDGAGELTLAGANTYNGGTVVLSGSNLSGTTTSLQGSITDDGAVIFDQAGTGAYSGAITGNGTLGKVGAGTVILNGVSTFTGTTTVNGGTLALGDASHPTASIDSAVTVGPGATLAGHGAVADVFNTYGGIVAPGGSIGTLTVAGNYAQGSTSTLSIEVSPTAASKLVVSGTASLGGTLALVYDPGIYTATTYDIVHAGIITGTFSTVSKSGSLPSNVDQSIVYTGTDVELVGKVVVAPTDDRVFGAVRTGALLQGQQANNTLLGHLADLHSGTGGDTAEAALATTSPAQLAFNGGAQRLNGMVAQLPDAMARLGGWFRAMGTFASLDGSDGAPGFNTQGGGFLAGIDRPIADHLVVGISGGYSHANIALQDNESATLDTPRFALYGSYARGPWALEATAGYAYDQIDAKRPIASLGVTAASNHAAHEVTAAAQRSHRFDLAGFAVMPAAGLGYVRLFDRGFSETGASGFDLSVASQNAASLRPFIAVSATKSFATDGGVQLLPEADARYSHEMFGRAPSLVQVGGGSFTASNIEQSRDALTLGGGITASMTDQLALFAAYHVTLPTGNFFEQTVSAGLTYKF